MADLNVNGHERARLRVLMVEDCELDATLLESALGRGGFWVVMRRVDTRDAMLQALREAEWDVILADHSMPQFSAPEALELVQELGLDLPFIIVSGHIEEATAVAAMRAGAHDYIMKDRLARLVPAVQRELREAEVRRARRESEQQLRRAHEELEMRVERRTAALRTANLKLENLLEERRRLENELLEIAENERRRIGFDLHDDLGQKLTGVSLMVKGLEQRLAADKLPAVAEARRIQQLVEEIIQHTHNLAHEFSALDATGSELTSVLKNLAENVGKTFSLSCSFTVKGMIPELPQHTATQFYKIAQEAVSNAIKHGKATELSIHVARDGDKLTMLVSNNGVPFSPPENAKKRMGLRIMNYRANTIGAALDIRPGDREGTCVCCCLSMRNNVRLARRDSTAPRSRVPDGDPPGRKPGATATSRV